MRWEERLVPPMLSLHVRRGDACNSEQIASKARRCDTLATYMDSVTSLAANFSYRTIFLATDDESVVADTVKYVAGHHHSPLLPLRTPTYFTSPLACYSTDHLTCLDHHLFSHHHHHHHHHHLHHLRPHCLLVCLSACLLACVSSFSQVPRVRVALPTSHGAGSGRVQEGGFRSEWAWAAAVRQLIATGPTTHKPRPTPTPTAPCPSTHTPFDPLAQVGSEPPERGDGQFWRGRGRAGGPAPHE